MGVHFAELGVCSALWCKVSRRKEIYSSPLKLIQREHQRTRVSRRVTYFAISRMVIMIMAVLSPCGCGKKMTACLVGKIVRASTMANV